LAASILSLPRILHNFREYETFTQARFNKNERLLNLLSSDFEKKLHEINQNISVKADNLIVDNLKSQLLSKADVRETNDIKVLASSKADLRIVEGISNELKVIITQIKDCKANILDHQHRLARLLEEVRKSLPGPISASQVENMLKEENHLLDMMYAAFEDHFRGPKDDIKERLRIYIPYLEQLPNVKNSHMLDIGCGRGEWLELLKEYGYIARGVDCNTAMIQRCIKLDLDVIQADALAFLAEQKENNYSVLTGFHIVEHLPLKDMISFFDESLRVLKPGGIMIIESPNPQNILVGSCNFYLDPTHRNPLPPAAAKFFIETRGFSSVEVLTLHPYPASYRLSGSALAERFNDYFYSAQDYAVIGYKT
jgi:O-antigen chain-terminating methyltransferase